MTVIESGVETRPRVVKIPNAPIYERAEKDWYVESREDALAFFGCERFSGTFFDPSCGGGNLPMAYAESTGLDIVRELGKTIWAADIANRWPRAMTFDFLTHPGPAIRIDNIVCNPPYSRPPGADKDLAWQFVEKALTIARHKVAILHRLAWGAEGCGTGAREGRSDWLERQPLARVWVYPWRVNMPPGDMLEAGTVKRGGGKGAFAWFVFEQGWQGPPQFLRLKRWQDKVTA